MGCMMSSKQQNNHNQEHQPPEENPASKPNDDAHPEILRRTTNFNSEQRSPAYPSNTCDGYPPIYLRKKPKDEIHFYLPMKDGKDDHRIACSWIAPALPSSSSSITTTTNNEETATKLKSNTISKEQYMYLQSLHPSLPSKIHNDDKPSKVIIICHGGFSWRNQMFLYNLAVELSLQFEKQQQQQQEQPFHCHIVRFDFRGNGHSSGTWKYHGYDHDLQDVKAVYDFVTNDLGCDVLALIGHSRGSAAVLNHAAFMEEEKKRNSIDGEDKTTITKYVNLAGRCKTKNESSSSSSSSSSLSYFTKEQIMELESTGKITFPPKGQREMIITKECIERHNSYEASELQTTNVLTIHGDRDTVVPMSNADKFDELIPNHTKFILNGAGHNFNGVLYIDQMTEAICNFLS